MKILPTFTRADADAVLDATLAAAADAEARGADAIGAALRADAAELRDEFAAHFGESLVFLVNDQGERAHVCVLRVLGTPAQAQRLAEAHGFVRFTIECGGVQVFASDPREASGAFKSYAQCRDEAQAERSPGRFRCCRCGALHCRCFDLGD